MTDCNYCGRKPIFEDGGVTWRRKPNEVVLEDGPFSTIYVGTDIRGRIYLSASGVEGRRTDCYINYCPMCGRKLVTPLFE